MSYGRLQEKEQALSAKIADLIEKPSRCDQGGDKAYQDKTGYEIPEDLKFKQDRLAKIKAAKKALEQREVVCAAHNFKKIAKAIVTGLIRPEFGNYPTNPAILISLYSI